MTSKRISYRELAEKVGDMILFNNHSKGNDEWYYGLYEQPLMSKRLEELDDENTDGMNEEEKEAYLDQHGHTSVTDFEIYQTYHITRGGAEYLFNHTSELISYDEKLDAYLWHIGHYGTSWTHVHATVHDFEDGDYDSYVSLSEMGKYMNN